ncbi:hypothetical protein CYMTET_54212 [Cymbomonas tetramitiformis]|uniref:Uncharacterized protein n=1 Tax=Cymbomonas tetramitiformis TaxID=36881 RepID=A0AAE0BGJ9_9CHLO|nr:hypothetical protein CYMTET_54212 [Cymbomonas tetramitiformis]
MEIFKSEKNKLEITSEWLKAKALEYFLPLGLVVAVALGLAWPWPGEEVGSWKVGRFRIITTINIMVQFEIFGLGLKTEDVTSALSAYVAIAYGLISILLVTPLLGFVMVAIPFSPDEFSTGLGLFCSVPTSLSGVNIIVHARGNTTLALLLIVVSNCLGIFTVPFMFKAIMANVDVSVNVLNMFVSLLLCSLLPLVAGKAIRESIPSVKVFTAEHKKALGMVNSVNMCCIVWQVTSRSADDILDQNAASMFAAVAAGILLHLIYLALNGVSTWALQLPWDQRTATWLLASQKSFAMAVAILTSLDEDEVGSHGLIAIPIILGHLSQLFIDSYIAARWSELETEEVDAIEEEDPKKSLRQSQSAGSTELARFNSSEGDCSNHHKKDEASNLNQACATADENPVYATFSAPSLSKVLTSKYSPSA